MRTRQAVAAAAFALAGCATAPVPAPVPIVPLALPVASPAQPMIDVGGPIAAIAVAGGLLFVALADSTVRVYDGSRLVSTAVPLDVPITRLVPFPDGPSVLALAPSGDRAWVVDGAHKPAASVGHTIGVGATAAAMTVDGAQVAIATDGAITAWKFARDHLKTPVGKPFPANAPFPREAGPRLLDMTYTWAAVARQGGGDVALFNVNGKTAKALPGSAGATALAVVGLSNSARSVLVGGASEDLAVYEVPGGARSVIPAVGAKPTHMVVDEGAERAFVAVPGRGLVVVDTTGRKVAGRVTLQVPGAIALVYPDVVPMTNYQLAHVGHVHPGGATALWVCDDGADALVRVDGETLAITGTVPLAPGRHDVAVAGQVVYAANMAAGTIVLVQDAVLQP